MLKSRPLTIGLGILLVGGGTVLADTPVMRSILRRSPQQQAQTEQPAEAPTNQQAQAQPERRFKGTITLPRTKAQANAAREVPKSPDAAIDVPGLEVTIGDAEPTATLAEPELNLVPTPTVDTGDPESPATKPIFDEPPFPSFPQETEPSPANLDLSEKQPAVPPQQQPRMQSFPQQYPNQNQEQPGFIQRRRMRRSGAMTTPAQQPGGKISAPQRALAQDNSIPSIDDIEMPSDALPALLDSPAATTAARPAALTTDGKKPLFSVR